jgi:Type III restriction enzyme, res subunit
MLSLAELKPGQSLVGLEPDRVAVVVAVLPIAADAVQVVYKTPDGTLKDRLLTSADLAGIAQATTERPWAFDGDGAAFQLTCEAKRIDLAFLFDPMMAVHTSNVEPLPHQITAVYESMLPRQPLRYVLADDPGAGKTIMAGLYIRELVMRADARRILIVAPGSLVEQWRDELFEKFGLEFRIYSPLLEQASPSGNPFEDNHQLIVRLDQMARNEDLQEKLCAAGWDLVVFDEAHKLAAHFFGSKLEKTGRFRFAEKIGHDTRHLLLMTATPHNGKEEDFQLFLSLLDSDRFYGKFRDGDHPGTSRSTGSARGSHHNPRRGQRLRPPLARLPASLPLPVQTLRTTRQRHHPPRGQALRVTRRRGSTTGMLGREAIRHLVRAMPKRAARDYRLQ